MCLLTGAIKRFSERKMFGHVCGKLYRYWSITTNAVFTCICVASIADISLESPVQKGMVFEISPAVAYVGKTIAVRCQFNSGDRSYQFAIYSPDENSDGTFCTLDCANNGCFHIAEESCLCDSIKPKDEAFCPLNATEVTYNVLNATDDMKGNWECITLDESGDIVSENFTLDIFVESEAPHIDDIASIELNDTVDLTCYSANGVPEPQFEWYVCSGDASCINLTEFSTQGEGQSTLSYTANQYHNEQDIICKVTQLAEYGSRNTSKQLNITFGGQVQRCLCNEPLTTLVKGYAVSLVCKIVSEGNPLISTFQWVINGTTQSQGQNYTIDKVGFADEGNYKCTGDNGIATGMTPSVGDAIVQYHPEDIQITGEISVIEGHQLSLVCQAKAKPDDIIYKWTYPSGTTEIPNLVIAEVQITDSGKYECSAKTTLSYCGDAVTGGDSLSTDVIILHTPKGKPTAGPADLKVPVETVTTLICNLENLESSGESEAGWILWHKDGTAVQNYTIVDGTTDWENLVSSNVSDSGSYTCQAGNIIGGSEQSEHIQVIVEAPSTFEMFESDEENMNPVYNDSLSGKFMLTCVVSASNIDDVEIQHNGISIDTEYFLGNTIMDNECQDCKYGVKTSVTERIMWKAREQLFESCNDVTYYDGTYQCFATATTIDEQAISYSDTLEIETLYGALWNSSSNIILAENDNQDIILVCDVCANPKPRFQWYFNGSSDKIKIEGANTSFIKIPVANDTTFGLYYCSAKNVVQDKGFPVELMESGPAGTPSDMQPLNNVTSSSLTLTWLEGRSGNHPPVVYFIKVGHDRGLSCNKTDMELFQKVNGTLSADSDGKKALTVIEMLQPSTAYCVHIHAENQKPSRNTTGGYLCQCGLLTAAVPIITDFKIEVVTSTEIIIRWTYQAHYVTTTYVGLIFLYNEIGHDQMRYPEDNTIDAVLQRVTIPGVFSETSTYEVVVNVYEANNQYPSPVPGISDIYYPITSKDKISTGGIAAIVLAVIYFLTLCVIAISILLGFVKVEKPCRKKSSTYEENVQQQNATGEQYHGQNEGPYMALHLYQNTEVNKLNNTEEGVQYEELL